MQPKPSLGTPKSKLVPCCSLARVWVTPLLKAGMSYQLWLQGLAVFHRQKGPNTPWRPSPAISRAVFPHTHNTHRGAMPALSHHPTPAVERNAQKSPSHPLVFGGCVGSRLSSSPTALYKLELPPRLFIQRVWRTASCLYCCELFANFWEETALSTPLGLRKGDRAIQPLVILFSTGELIGLITKVCTVARALPFSLLQFQIVKKITITITMKTQFLLSEEEKSASTQ